MDRQWPDVDRDKARILDRTVMLVSAVAVTAVAAFLLTPGDAIVGLGIAPAFWSVLS